MTAAADRVIFGLPRLSSGSFQVSVAGIDAANLTTNDHEVLAIYEGGYDMSEPVPYSPEFRNNDYKTLLRIYGAAEGDRVGLQKLIVGMCPDGAPGYDAAGDACSCAAGFLEEPFGGAAEWTGEPETLRIEWGEGRTRFLRNGVEVVGVDWSTPDLAFGPDELHVSIGTPRPEAVGSASMPIGAVFSNVVVDGVIAPDVATCPQ